MNRALYSYASLFHDRRFVIRCYQELEHFPTWFWLNYSLTMISPDTSARTPQYSFETHQYSWQMTSVTILIKMLWHAALHFKPKVWNPQSWYSMDSNDFINWYFTGKLWKGVQWLYTMLHQNVISVQICLRHFSICNVTVLRKYFHWTCLAYTPMIGACSDDIACEY